MTAYDSPDALRASMPAYVLGALSPEDRHAFEAALRQPDRIAALRTEFDASQVWDMNFDSDTNVVEVAIRRLRAKIDDDFEPKLVRTVRGMGYVLEAPELP